MLTFEDFFSKKKINLEQFEVAEPVLFAEFFQHYPLMGEKSFDHSKKYWFNTLRRNYPLATEVKPHALKAEAISDMAIQGIAAAAAQNLDLHPHQPKFMEDHLAELVDENVSVKEVSLAEEEKIIIESANELTVAKPAFKPRFNAKNTKKPEDNSEKIDTENIEVVKSQDQDLKTTVEPTKPAFKPRFNMQNIKKDAVKEASKNDLPNINPLQDISTDNHQPEHNQTKIDDGQIAKPIFKPRFNPKKKTDTNEPE